MKENCLEKNKIFRLVCRIVTTLACVLMMVFIFCNSLQTGEESSTQSSAVVDTVQKVVAVFAPESPIATATGKAYEKLHSAVRIVAHFLEFAVFGALCCWCWYSYTDKKIFLLAPTGAIVLVPVIDECLQTLTAGRAAEWLDIAVDISGGIVGGFCALCTLTIGILIYHKYKAKKADGAAAQSVAK